MGRSLVLFFPSIFVFNCFPMKTNVSSLIPSLFLNGIRVVVDLKSSFFFFVKCE